MMAKPAVIHKGGVPATLVKRIRRKCGRVWSAYRLVRAKERFRRREGRTDRTRVAFVMGCQRSGTNMTLWTLDRSMDVDVIEESDPRAFVHCRVLDKAVRDAIVERSTAQCVIFKPICDSHRALELYAEDPGSKGVWVYRNYRDVANSAVRYWGDQSRQFMLDLLDGGGDWGIAQWNREKLSDECLSTLREAAGDALTVHEAAALFWYMRNRTFFDQELQHQPSTMLTRYEDMVTNPLTEFERLFRFLDVRFRPDMVQEVFSTSVRRHSFAGINRRVEELCDHLLERLNAVRAASD